MRARRVLKTALVLGMLLLLTPSVGHAQTAVGSTGPQIGLGFGPTSIEPLSVGVPVFSVGDEIWVQSYYNSTSLYVSLVPPTGSTTQSTGLGPGEIVRLYTIAPGDPAGVWTVVVSLVSAGTISTFGLTVGNASSSLVPNFVSAAVQSNTAALEYSLPPTAAYDIQACSVGLGLGSTATFTLPSSIGGVMSVTLAGDSAVISVPFANGPFSGWFELFTARGYQNGTSLVTQEVLAAQTGVLSLGSSNSTVIGKLGREMSLREGRYDLRAYVRGPSGFSAYETQFLFDGSSWVSLSGCTQLQEVTSGTFALTTNLDASNSTWPRSMYLMYAVDGRDSFSEFAVPVAPGRIDVGTTTGLGLEGPKISLSGSGILSWSAHGSRAYFEGTGFPENVSVRIDFEGVASEAFNVIVPGSFEHVSLRLDAGLLNIITRNNGAPLQNATVYVSGRGGAPAASSSGIDANETMMLPPGEYNVTATYAGKTASAQVEVASGGTATLTLDITPPQSQIPAYVLGTVLIIAAALNIVVWREYLLRRAVLK